MSRKKLFIENMFAYGLINILSKVVPFLLLPIVTKMLPDPSDFGIYSIYTTIVGLGTPLAVLGLYDAMFREFFEKDELQYKYNVTTTAQRIVMISSIFIAVVLIVFRGGFSSIIFGDSTYKDILVLAAIGIFLSANQSPIQAPTRMQNKRKLFVFSGLLSSIATYVVALWLIFRGFAFLGLIYASIITTAILLTFFWMSNRKFFLKGTFDTRIAKELFKIGLPLLPTFLIYWIYNSMDKIMIANMLGTLDLGIYSIGSKMAQVSQLIYAGFSGGWQYFAFSTMKDNDQIELNSKVFEFLGVVSVLSLIVIYPFISFAFSILFEGEYILGYTVAPYLYLSPLLLMLFQVVANQFLVIKSSYLITGSLTLGAVVNVVLNYVLIGYLGIEGAAIATLVAYMVTLVTIMIVSYSKSCMQYSKKMILVLVLAPVYLFIQRVFFDGTTLYAFLVSLVVILLFVSLYQVEINGTLKKIRFLKKK